MCISKKARRNLLAKERASYQLCQKHFAGSWACRNDLVSTKCRHGEGLSVFPKFPFLPHLFQCYSWLTSSMGNQTFEVESDTDAGLACDASHLEERRDLAWSLCEPQLTLFSWLQGAGGVRKSEPAPPSYVSSAVLSHLALTAHLFRRVKRAVAPHTACESNPFSTVVQASASSAQ